MADIWFTTASFLREIETCIKDDLSQTILHSQTIQGIYILVELYKKDHQRPIDLAMATHTAATSFTPIVDKLEAAKLVVRTANPNDRRSVLISLTVEGKRLQAAVENAIANAEVRYGGK